MNGRRQQQCRSSSLLGEGGLALPRWLVHSARTARLHPQRGTLAAAARAAGPGSRSRGAGLLAIRAHRLRAPGAGRLARAPGALTLAVGRCWRRPGSSRWCHGSLGGRAAPPRTRSASSPRYRHSCCRCPWMGRTPKHPRCSARGPGWGEGGRGGGGGGRQGQGRGGGVRGQPAGAVQRTKGAEKVALRAIGAHACA